MRGTSISGGVFDLPELEASLASLKEKTLQENFWNNKNYAQTVLKKISVIEKELETFRLADERNENLEVLFELAEEDKSSEDKHLLKELKVELDAYKSIINNLELKLMLGAEDDMSDAILTIHPGAGGTESQDWAEMLYRMYLRWIERQEFSSKVIDFQPGDEAGIKDVTLEVKGEFAYGLLKAEAGVHRLVRISPFDSSNRRHTSFASIFVYPSSDEEIEVEINQDDLKIDTYRASGAGGQHVNKTDSAVRITHLPSGIVVQCQNERSQHKNKANALKVLKARLHKLQLEQQAEAIKELEDQKQDIGWGSQIRSYVFHPYNMVKDHRTKYEVGDVKRVMDGDLTPFIRSFLLKTAAKG
jgi:peptide chain release factor 2|tara:strand:- start:19965 stop:21041 length:1077 start_codon:yes stop_codon:yes gene_type:complete